MNKFVKEIAKQISMGLKQYNWSLFEEEFEVDGILCKITRTGRVLRVSTENSTIN